MFARVLWAWHQLQMRSFHKSARVIALCPHLQLHCLDVVQREVRRARTRRRVPDDGARLGGCRARKRQTVRAARQRHNSVSAQRKRFESCADYRGVFRTYSEYSQTKLTKQRQKREQFATRTGQSKARYEIGPTSGTMHLSAPLAVFSSLARRTAARCPLCYPTATETSEESSLQRERNLSLSFHSSSVASGGLKTDSFTDREKLTNLSDLTSQSRDISIDLDMIVAIVTGDGCSAHTLRTDNSWTLVSQKCVANFTGTFFIFLSATRTTITG